MSTSCKQCGAVLTERDAFCTKCGARRSNFGESGDANRFCTKCGAALAAETKFCTKCGAPMGGEAGTPSPAATSGSDSGKQTVAGAATVVTTTKAAPQAAVPVAPAAKSAAPIPRIVIVGGGIVVLSVVAIVGGFIYAAHRARQKAAQIEATYNIEKNLADLSAAGSAAQQKANKQTPADINKSLADLAAAANALAQNAQKQAAAIPPNAIPAIPGGSSPSNASSNSGSATSTSTPAAAASMFPGCTAGTPVPAQPPPVPAAATGNQARDWALKYERTVGGPEADLVVRTGDINNLGFGWPKGFDPFSGQSTPAHSFPWKTPADEPEGTDRITVASVVTQADLNSHGHDGYSNSAVCSCPTPNPPPCQARLDTMPRAITLALGKLPSRISAVLFQIFADDFQAPVYNSHFQVSLNGTRIPTFEYALNSLNQTGPIGKLVTLKLLPEYWPLLKSGTVKLLIDDPTTHQPDGYAVDFVRILVNPGKFMYQVSLAATVTDADKHTPIAGATVSAALQSASTDRLGKCELKGIPAGLVVATADAPGYDENSVPVDLVAGQSGNAEIQLHHHQENTAALEKSIAQTGTATIYGIHFDTGSSKLRPDSLPALNAVLGLIDNHAGSRWIIAGHTDNQGSAAHNQTLSVARAKSVVTWLKDHGVDVQRLVPQGFGATRPVADNATANGRALNRRVEVALAK
ncbi:MAG: OmpA family protein [Candidatus Acidiferrales bacterium]